VCFRVSERAREGESVRERETQGGKERVSGCVGVCVWRERKSMSNSLRDRGKECACERKRQ